MQTKNNLNGIYKYNNIKKYSKLKLFSEFVFNNFVWVVLIIIAIIASIVNPIFYSPTNLINVLIQSATLSLLVLAESICFITKHFDLTVESTMVITGVLGGWLVSTSGIASGWNLNTVLVIFLVLLVGALIGMLNGFLIAFIGVNPFIATLALSIFYTGLAVYITKGQTIYPLNDTYNFLGRGKIGYLPMCIIFFIIIYILMHIVLTYTPFGRKLYVVGGNRLAASAAGINVKLIILAVYTLSGIICASAGWMLSGRLNAAAPQMSSGVLMTAFAAAVIGGVDLNGGEGKVFGMMGGVLLMSFISNLMNLANLDPYIIQASTGLIILLAMIMQTLRKGKLGNIY